MTNQARIMIISFSFSYFVHYEECPEFFYNPKDTFFYQLIVKITTRYFSFLSCFIFLLFIYKKKKKSKILSSKNIMG